MPATEYRKVKTGLAVVTLFLLFAGEALRSAFGWIPFGALSVIIAVTYIVIIVRQRSQIHWKQTPFWLALFVVLALLSVTWAYSPANTALTLVPFILVTLGACGIFLTLPWSNIVRALGTTLRWILAASLVFELWVSVFIGHAIYPVYVDTTAGKIPAVYQWSRNLLFEGGPIQGIVGNRNQLGFIAVIALVVFCVQLADRTIWRSWGIIWVGIAVVTLLLTRSATDLLALGAVIVVLLFALWMRRVAPGKRKPVYAAALLLVAVSVVLYSVARPALLAVLGKSEDLTGRLDIWASVSALAEQRPVAGWGWLSPWVPWLEPFNDLAVYHGVHYLQAHNMWLDIWLQLGVLGVITLAFTMLSVMWRSWFIAIDRPRWDLTDTRPFTASSLVPLLITSALLVQSFAESQLVLQSGWALVVILSLTVKNPAHIHRSSARQG